jgi:hypothetical protein
VNESLGDDREGFLLRRMTVAHIREPPGKDYVEVMFCDSARFYQLPRESPSFEASLRLLEEAVAVGECLTITLASLDSDVIEGVARR